MLPEQDAVLAITAGVNDMQGVLTKVWDCLLPGMKPTPLAPNSAAQTTLSERLAGLCFTPPAGESTSAQAARVSARDMLFAPNEVKVARARFDFAADTVTLTLQRGRRQHTLKCGLGVWHFDKTTWFGRGPQKVAGSGVWTTPDTFQITLRYYETPFYQTITCQFTEEGVTVQQVTNVGFGTKKAPELNGHFA